MLCSRGIMIMYTAAVFCYMQGDSTISAWIILHQARPSRTAVYSFDIAPFLDATPSSAPSGSGATAACHSVRPYNRSSHADRIELRLQSVRSIPKNLWSVKIEWICADAADFPRCV